MRRILVCTGVLGGGTALVFAFAALTAAAFPQGTLVSGGWNGGWQAIEDRAAPGWGGGVVPVPMPAVEWAPMVERDLVDDGFTIPNDGFESLPGDTVVTPDGESIEVAPAP